MGQLQGQKSQMAEMDKIVVARRRMCSLMDKAGLKKENISRFQNIFILLCVQFLETSILSLFIRS